MESFSVFHYIKSDIQILFLHCLFLISASVFRQPRDLTLTLRRERTDKIVYSSYSLQPSLSLHRCNIMKAQIDSSLVNAVSQKDNPQLHYFTLLIENKI